MPTTRRHPHDHEDGPTVLFERQPPASRCPICPYRHVLENMSQETSAIPRRGILPLPTQRHPDAPKSPLPTQRHPDAPTSPLPLPPLRPLPASAPLPRPSLLPDPPTAAPRPSLLPDPRGSGTLILPDALKPGGPEAATIARPQSACDAPPHPSTPAPFDELASPDITVLQIPVVPTPRPRRKPAPDPRAFYVLNLCLGLLIVVGVLALVAHSLRPAAATPAPAATPEPHAAP